MFRRIRKTQNEITIDNAKKLLAAERIGVLAVNGDNGYPYAVPINYLYCEKENKIFFHGSRAGHKIDSINNSDKVCFTVFGNETVKKEEWAPFVQSVVVFGRCRIIGNRDLSIELLNRFAKKYYPSDDLIRDEIMKAGAAAQMFEIEIEYLTGKEIQEK